MSCRRDIPGAPRSLTATNPCALIGFILGVASIVFYVIGIIPLAALVLSIIGLTKAEQRGGQGRVLAWIGIILGGVHLAMNYVEWHAPR